jgi:hypothetical protein
MLQDRKHVEIWGELGPAMRKLPNDKWRMFARAYATGKPGLGAATNACRAAGFSKNRPDIARKYAWQLVRDPRMIAAIEEEARNVIRLGAPEAARALLNLVRNEGHKDHARGIGMLLDRVYPVMTVANVEVTHKIASPDDEALEELRAVRKLGATREKLLELFGFNGLERLEAIEARRAENATEIDGEAEVVEPPKDASQEKRKGGPLRGIALTKKLEREAREALAADAITDDGEMSAAPDDFNG